jgi:hypothetical protein
VYENYIVQLSNASTRIQNISLASDINHTGEDGKNSKTPSLTRNRGDLQRVTSTYIDTSHYSPVPFTYFLMHVKEKAETS